MRSLLAASAAPLVKAEPGGIIMDAVMGPGSPAPALLLTEGDSERGFARTYRCAGNTCETGEPAPFACGHYGDDRTDGTLTLSYKQDTEQPKVERAGCRHLLVGGSDQLSASGTTPGGCYRWSAEPSSVLGVSGTESSADAKAGEPGRATFRVEHEARNGKKAEANLPESVVTLSSVTGGAAIPTAFLARADAANPAAIETGTPSEAPAEAEAKRAAPAARRANNLVYKKHETVLAPLLDALLTTSEQRGARDKQKEVRIMRTLKLAAALSIVLLLGMFPASAAAQDEETEETAKDTPYFSGMPSYRIADANDRKFAAYKFWNGTSCATVEGKKLFRAYTLKEGGEAASDLQISRNYASAVRNMGGAVVFEGLCEGADCAENCGYQMMVGKVLKGGGELWVEVVPFNDGNDYYLTVVAKEAMIQEVTAGAMFEALNKEGRVALYINFDTGKSTIRPDSTPIIEQIVQMMRANADLDLSVEGHTDNVGNAKSNQSLSENRARAVVEAIAAQGIDAKRMSAVGRGQDKPVADNSSEEGRAKNRRVELVRKASP